MKRFLSFFVFIFAFLPLALAPTGVLAKCTSAVCLENPLGSVESPQILIGNAIDAVLGVVGSLALVMFVFGGLVWMTSAGSAEKVKKGRDILIWATIGLAIIFSAYGLVRFVIKGIGA